MVRTQPSPTPNLVSIKDVEALLETFFDGSIDSAHRMSPHYATLWREMKRITFAGGKRLRPRMVLLTYQAFGGDDAAAVVPVAAAQEVLHASLLMHDDIIDRDFIRYGTPNVMGGYQKIYQPLVKDAGERTHYAESAALLGGDLLISAAYQLIGQSSLPPEKVALVYQQLGETIFQVAGGELLDTESALRPVGAIPAELIAIHKTASYTFVAPLLIGATLAGITAEQKVFLRIYAENLGVAFQLQDDLLGVFGDDKQTGKSTTGDLREGKRTYMVEQFYALASDAQKATFEKSFGNDHLTDVQAEELRALLIEAGAKVRTEEIIATYEQRARKALDELLLFGGAHQQFTDLIDKAIRRTK